MLALESHHLEDVYRHAEESYPRECCGIFLGGTALGEWRVEMVVRAANLAPAGSVDRYVMDPADRLRAEALAKEEHLSIVGFYHSHPDHDVYFSKTDLQNSEEYLLGEPWLAPTYSYLVVSVGRDRRMGFGAFLVRNGESEQIQVKLE